MSDEEPEWVRVYNEDGEPEDLVLRTKSGRVLTDADIQALSQEAERGYDVTGVRKVKPENTLLHTTDARVWAEEFCRIFDGKFINRDVGLDVMVTWFANAIEVGSLRSQSSGDERAEKNTTG